MSTSKISKIIVYANQEDESSNQRIEYAEYLSSYFGARLQSFPADWPTPFKHSSKQYSSKHRHEFSSLLELSRDVDLIVIGQNAIGNNSAYEEIILSATQLAIHSDCPALVIPSNLNDNAYELPIKRPLIIWNYCDANIDALRNALPFLKGRSASLILSENKNFSSITARGSTLKHDIADFFQANGINCRRVKENSEETYMNSEDIISLINQEGHDLLIMRAYGHRKMHDLYQGFLPRNILNRAGRPVLLTA